MSRFACLILTNHYGKIGNKICKYFICIKCIWVFWLDATWKFKYTGNIGQSMQTTSGLRTRSLDTTEMVLGKEQKVWRPSLCFDKGGTTVNIVDSCITLLNFSPCIPVNLLLPLFLSKEIYWINKSEVLWNFFFLQPS